MMSTYIQKRRLRYYAVLEIPKELRPQLRRPRFVKSLETDSLATAKRRVGRLVDEWKRSIDQARAAAGKLPTTTADDAAYFRRALRDAKTEAERSDILEHIELAANDIGLLNVDIGQLPSSDPEAQRFYAEATGARVPTLEHLDEWLSTSTSTPKTRDMQRSDVKRFAVKFPMLSDVQRPAVRRWVTALMNEENLTPKTVQRVLSALRGYWRYLQTINVVPENEEPFARLDVARQAKARSAADKRQPFEPADVVKLVAAAEGRSDTEMADLIRLAMWTGCRIEELCALRVEDVNGDSFKVREAKSAAGVRVVPIHAELQPVMARLIAASKDGYVLSGLGLNKYGDRSNGVGKRFGHMKTALGFGAPFVFHSIRKTVITILENAGVSENVVADIVGHEKPRITYGLYSGGATLGVKRAALAKLVYPLDLLVGQRTSRAETILAACN